MSNIFKSNSRFASLIDDIPVSTKKEQRKEKENETIQSEADKFNTFKSERKEGTFRNGDNKKDRYTEEFKLQESKKQIQECLQIDNFPELISNDRSLATDKKNNINFAQLLKNKVEVKENNENVDTLDPELIDLKPGYTLIKTDPKTRKIIFKSHPNTDCQIEQKIIKSEKEIAYDEKEGAYEILEELVKLHQRRTQEYIELNGYDMWEKMFKFPNWEEEDYSDSDDEYDEEEDEFEEYDDEFYYEY
jgi:hypothetical protein